MIPFSDGIPMKSNPNRGYGEIVIKRLLKKYPEQEWKLLRYVNRTELFVAALLSPQTTDKQTNNVTIPLFKRFKSFKGYAEADPTELRRYLRGINYYKTKARNLRMACKMIVNQFGGKLPKSLDELMQLPGVGRKVANVVLTHGYGISEGIAIDTHCITVANRLKLTRTRKPEIIEKDLMRKIPKRHWRYTSNLLIALGRDTCRANRKDCYRCVMKDICPSSNAKT